MDYLNQVIQPRYSVQSIRKEYQAGKKMRMMLFWGHQPAKNGLITMSCFSQWWHSVFEVDGQEYSCMEQFMMAGKAKLFGDKEILDAILNCSNPKQIKALGRKVKGFDEDIWNQHKYTIIYYGNYMKFSQNQELGDFLIATKDSVIAEASPYDGIWGIKMSANDEGAENPMKWRGQNLLGFALMQVRDELLG